MKKRLIALLLVLALLIPAAVAAAAYYRVANTTSLNLRQLPSTKSTSITSFKQDWALTVQQKIGDWSYVTFTNGREGYVMNKYIAKGSSYRAYITADDTPLRSGPAYSFSNVGILAKGAKVTVLTHGKMYDFVSTSVGKGYVLNARLSKKYVKPSGKASEKSSSKVDYTAWVVNGGKTVNLRVGPSSTSNVITSYPSGTEVTVMEHNPTWDFITVKEDGNTGYMMNTYLSKYKPAPMPTVEPTAAPFVPYQAYITSENQKAVNMRKKPGKGYAAITTIPYGAEVTVQKEGDWYKVSYRNLVGYVERQYIQLDPPDPVITPEPTATAKPTATPKPFEPYDATIVCPEGEKVNVRSGEGKGYTHILRLSPGTKVRVVALGKKMPNEWAKIKYNGFYGYVMREFLQKIK